MDMTTRNGAGENILVVDDDATNLKLIDRILRSAGYDALTLVKDPREVLVRYREVRPDLILLDVNMPHLDGYEVLQALHNLDDELLPPVIIFTADGNRASHLRALSEGARDFISKPFDRDELIMRVRNHLEAYREHRALHERKSSLESMVRARTEELRWTQHQIVKRLGRAAEYRDEETGSHIMRVSQGSALIARAIGWSEADCELILNASPMHDIGKIGIPDAILLKPGKLDPDEWRVMQTHTTIGASLLDEDNSDLLRMARDIALSHHEKWDGSGYPAGLSGDAIPIEGRIVALADVFDALTSERLYKKAWTIEAALDMIRENRAKHFDPRLTDVFLREIDGILEIGRRYAEQPVRGFDNAPAWCNAGNAV